MYKIFDKVTKVQPYHNPTKLSTSSIRSKLNCDYALNGWVFNFDTFAPCDWLKIDGEVIKQGKYHDWALCIDSNGQPHVSTDYTMPCVLSGTPILKDGKKIYRNLTPDVARPAQRTAVFWTKEGKFGIWVDRAILSPEALRNKLLAIGAVDALMMDGGGSTQVSCKTGSLYSSRKVATLICVWTEETKPQPQPQPKPTNNPYPVPTRTLKMNHNGEDVKWLQYQLNIKINANLPITGNFYTMTRDAVVAFQKTVFSNFREWDGMVGAKTRAKLLE